MMAAMAMGATGSPVVMSAREGFTIPLHKAPAPAKKGEAIAVENLLCSGRSKARCRKPWPYSGKNKTQRARLGQAFQSI
jgi:hypothetical protein